MRFNKLFLLWLLVITLAVADKKMQLDFSNLDINEFVKIVSKITHKNILITAPISGKIDFISDHGISMEELFVLLQNVLQSKGFTLVEKNGFLTTVRVADASKEAPPLQEGSVGQIHTQVIQVESANANTLSAQLRFLLSNSGKLVVSTDNNAFIITDYPENTRLIKELILKLDSKKSQEIVFLEMKYVNVGTIYGEFVKIVNSIYDPKIVQQSVSVFKNDATNMLILVGNTDQLKRLKGYLDLLDKPDKITKQRLAMITLKNADATELVKILTDIVTKKTYPKDAIKPSISADKDLNALIFIASGEEITEFEELLKELDKERQQVYVLAKVMEISKNNADKLGVTYGLERGGIEGGTLYTLSADLGGSTTPIDTAAALGAGLSLGLNVNLLLTNGAAKTLSEPSILCINNQESTIYVGQTQSIKSGTTNNAVSGITDNYSREDIGLSLKIKPRISSDLKVSLQVETKLEDVVPGGVVGLPTTTKREVKTTAIVSDGESVIIGGLIRQKESKIESKIPLLGSIPLLGWLFTNEDTSTDEVNLVVILTPYIVNKSGSLSALREKLTQLHAVEQKFINETLKKLKKKDD